MLKADHRKVEDWFAKFERASCDDRKRALPGKICNALRVHTQIEEEIFHLAFYEATGYEDLLQVATVFAAASLDWAAGAVKSARAIEGSTGE